MDNLEDSYRWDKFYEACDMDLPNVPVIKVLNNLRLLNDVYIFSGRSVAVKAKTIDWISRYTSFSENELKEEPFLRMRNIKDFTPDEDLKRSWYEELSFSDKKRLVAVFDDRNKVVNMWRSLGVPCFQVADGNF